MIRFFSHFSYLLLLVLMSCSSSAKKLITDPGPGDNYMRSAHFEVTVEGAQSYVYENFKRNTGEKYLQKTPMESFSWTSFVSVEPVEVVVSFLNEEDLDSVVIRPLSLNIEGEIQGNTVKFTMPAGRKVTIEKYNDLKYVCFLFGHLEEPKPEGISAENTIAFEPGVHYLENDMQILKSNQAVWLKPGAVVHGRIHGEDIDNAQIVGRGILTASHVERSDLKFGEGYAEKRASRPLNISGTNLRVQGPTIVDAPFWSTRIEGTDSTKLSYVSHTSVLGWYVNSDGFQDMTHVRASDLFTCVNDDSFILNNIGDCVVERSVVWGQVAGAPLRLGWNGVEDLDTIIYRDIDILHFWGNAGVISLKHGGPSHVRNIIIEDIRIEDQMQRFLELEIKKHIWSPEGTGFGYVSNIVIKDITIHNPFINRIPSHVNGVEGHIIKDVTLENVQVAGKRIRSFDELNIVLNEYTENIKIK